MRTYRKILHLDLDSFYVAVEENLHPDLRGQRIAVGGRPEERGVVASASYAARQLGVRSAMPMSRALRLCPDLIVLPSNFKAYHAASHEVMAHLHKLTPLVEQISVDEAFLDVTILPRPAEDIARELQATINKDLSLPCSFGIASNKLVAKIANNVGKDEKRSDKPPNAIKVVPPGHESVFLAPLPIKELWGVGPKTAEKLKQLGIRTIGEIAATREKDLTRLFGKLGTDLAHHARGLDERPVEAEHETKSISKEITFVRDENNLSELKRVLRHLADAVGRQTRKANLSGATIKIKLRWSDFTTLTRQLTLDYPTNQDEAIFAAALELFNQNWPPQRPVRLIGVGISGFEEPHRQLSLWDKPQELEQSQRLQSTLDNLRERFGDQSIQRGSLLKADDDD